MARTHTSQLIVELLDRVTGPSKAVGRAMRDMGKRIGDATGSVPSATQRVDAALARNRASLAGARAGVVDAVGAFYTLRAAIGAPVKAASEFESAMADVRKVVDFPTPKAFEEFKAGLMDMSTRVPVAVNGLAEIAAAAGQAGIAGEDLNRFTEMAAKVGTAFDIGAGEAGDSLAKLMTGLSLSIDEASSLSDAMNHLSNSQASSAAEILDVVRRVGATGKQYGYTAEQTSAFASAMISAGAESEVAATSFRNMGRALTMGAAATKSQRKAFGELGLDAERVSIRMQEDAVGTTIDVMERIATLPKHQQASISTLLFGSEARALGPLLTNLDLVRDSIGMVASEAEYAGSAQREYNVRSKTFANMTQLLGNRLTALKITIGNALIPVLTDLIEGISPIIDRMAEWIALHPRLAGGLFAATASLIAFRGALSALRFVGLLGQGGALSMLSLALHGVRGAAAVAKGAAVASFGAMAGALARARTAAIAFSIAASMGPATAIRSMAAGALVALSPLRLLRGALALTTAAMRVLKVAVIGTGIGAILLGIGAAGMWIYKNWSGLKAMFQAFGAAFMKAVDPIRPAIDPIINAIKSAVNWVRNLTGKVDESGAAWTGWGAAAGTAVGNAVKAVADAIGKIVELIGKANAALKSLNPNMAPGAKFRGSAIGDVREGSFLDRVLPNSDKDSAPLSAPRLKGGPVSRGSTRLVGEDGPEVFTAGRSGYVHPNGAGGSGAGIGTVNFNPTIHVSGSGDPEAVARRVLARLKDEASAALRGAMADIQMG